MKEFVIYSRDLEWIVPSRIVENRSKTVENSSGNVTRDFPKDNRSKLCKLFDGPCEFLSSEQMFRIDYRISVDGAKMDYSERDTYLSGNYIHNRKKFISHVQKCPLS